jgi:hypothetical protein
VKRALWIFGSLIVAGILMPRPTLAQLSTCGTITSCPAAASVNPSDKVPIVQNGTTKVATVNQFLAPGTITGPASSTVGDIATFNNTLGTMLSDSGVKAANIATSGANSNITSLSGLTTPLSLLQGGTAATSLGSGIINTGGILNLGQTHLVVYTVAPGSASASDKARADFVGNGVDDETACNDAVSAAGYTSSSEIILLPGTYTFGAACDIITAPGSIFMAEGTTVTGPTGSADTFTINLGQVTVPDFSKFYFGNIKTNSTGSAIRNYGNASNQYIGWQSIVGTSEKGNGYYADANTSDGGDGESVITLGVGFIGYTNYGIYLNSNTNIDTFVANSTNGMYLSHNNKGLYIVSNEVGDTINSNTWNLDVDATWSGSSVGIETNGIYDIFNVVVGGVTGGPNITLDSGAQYNIFTLTPLTLATGSGSIVNNSGEGNNFFNNIPFGYEPTFTCATGSPGAYTRQAGYYQQVGSLTYVSVDLAAGAGTCSGAVSVSLPFVTNAAIYQMFPAADATANTGLQCVATNSASTCTLKTYSGSNFAMGDILEMTGTYTQTLP